MIAPIRRAIEELPASKIREVSLAARGIDDVIGLWFGEGDEVTPAFIRDAAAAALARGETFYGPNLGLPELRAAIRRYLARTYATEVPLERIAVSASGMNALMIVSQCLVGHGDSAVVIGPVWPNVERAIAALGATPRRVDLTPTADGGWQLDLDRVAAACDDTTRLVFVNSPGNPTGWLASEAELAALLALARARGMWLVSDEVYGRLVYDRPVAPSLIPLATADDPVVVVNSLSKSWSMTGWRLGWIVAPPALISAIEKMTEFNVSHPTSFAQWGGVAALDQGDAYIAGLVRRYAAAGAQVYARLAALPRVRLAPPRASFYAFFAVDGMTDSLGFAKALIARARVGLAPGVAFGAAGEGRLRLCFASSTARLDAALDRLEPHLR